MALANAAPVCAAGKCDFQCQAPFIRCGMACIDPRADPNNCGGCNKPCPAMPGGVPTCIDNQCGMSCAAGDSSCNGKCVDTSSDSDNCGSCGNKCNGKDKTCTLGVCAMN
jgi:hypothetical protein